MYAIWICLNCLALLFGTILVYQNLSKKCILSLYPLLRKYLSKDTPLKPFCGSTLNLTYLRCSRLQTSMLLTINIRPSLEDSMLLILIEPLVHLPPISNANSISSWIGSFPIGQLSSKTLMVPWFFNSIKTTSWEFNHFLFRMSFNFNTSIDRFISKATFLGWIDFSKYIIVTYTTLVTDWGIDKERQV